MELFIARQPIFTQQQQVYAYELLFRSGTANAFPEVDANHASARKRSRVANVPLSI
jgi:EAL and modified HD-GYP domain-containing signal transduction protein